MKGILALLMAGIMMAVMIAPAMSASPTTSANVGGVASTYVGTATVTTAPGPGSDGVVNFSLVVTDLNGAGDISDTGWTAEWGGRSAVTLTKSAETTTTKTFVGSDTIPYCTATGDKTVSFKLNTAEVATAVFNVGSYAGFTLSFAAITYGNVNISEKKVVTPGTLHNVGNSNMTTKINATKMTPGTAYNASDPANVDMNLDARVEGTTGVEKDLPAGTWVLFAHEFECCTPEALDFSITAPAGTSGQYTGLIEIAAQ